MDPHGDAEVVQTGVELDEADIVVVLLHGRGDTAEGIMLIAAEIDVAEVCYLAPQAADFTWYPHSFLAPIEDNEPWLTSALQAVDTVVGEVYDAGIPPERLVLMGFSQGACLALEYAARHPATYAAVVGLSGGLIGPDGTSRDYPGSLKNVPIFLGCSDVDPHVPLGRVEHTVDVLSDMGADVTARIYPDMGHTVNANELRVVRELLINAALG